jgi:anaerobic ribonucleoside-triphosphate reductase
MLLKKNLATNFTIQLKSIDKKSLLFYTYFLKKIFDKTNIIYSLINLPIKKKRIELINIFNMFCRKFIGQIILQNILQILHETANKIAYLNSPSFRYFKSNYPFKRSCLSLNSLICVKL